MHGTISSIIFAKGYGEHHCLVSDFEPHSSHLLLNRHILLGRDSALGFRETIQPSQVMPSLSQLPQLSAVFEILSEISELGTPYVGI
jgi:hypothetical protein